MCFFLKSVLVKKQSNKNRYSKKKYRDANLKQRMVPAIKKRIALTFRLLSNPFNNLEISD
jgi:hypothetical protein